MTNVLPVAEPVTRSTRQARAVDRWTPLTKLVWNAARTRSWARPASTEGSDAVSPLEVWRQHEVHLTRSMVYIVFTLAAGVVALLPFLGGDPVAKWALYGAVLVGFADSAWMFYISSHPDRYTELRGTVAWIGAGASVCAGVYYFGVFSPAAMVPVLAVHFVALTQSAGIARGFGTLIVGFHVGASLLFIGGISVDRGLLHADYLSTVDQLGVASLVALLMVCAYGMGRVVQHGQSESVAEFERAVRVAEQRRVLLKEAERALDKALGRVGHPGRYTDQQLGSFRIGVVMGHGAMGEVYLGTRTDQSADGPIAAAVKVLHAHSCHRPDIVQRFVREARAVGALDAPNIVAVLEASATGASLPFIAMERLVGHDLAYHLRHEGSLSPAEVVALVRQVGDGLAAAAAAGIVHRDLKPRNLFLHEAPGAEPVWKILDFGVAKLEASSGTLTESKIVGTPAYMAPEQARGQNTDYRSDLHALGAIAYRALTGHPPFTAKDIPTTLHNVVYTMPLRPSHLADLPRAVDAVLLIALAKEPNERFSCGAELADALESALAAIIRPAHRRRAEQLEERTPWRDE